GSRRDGEAILVTGGAERDDRRREVVRSEPPPIAAISRHGVRLPERWFLFPGVRVSVLDRRSRVLLANAAASYALPALIAPGNEDVGVKSVLNLDMSKA